MKQLTQTQRTLLHLLGDGYCHNGNELGKALNMTRSAIWKQINQLIQLGISITRRPQQGYQLLNPLQLLNEQHIKNALRTQGFTSPFSLHIPTSIHSTNRYLKELPKSSIVDLCCAEQQTHGRGRFERHWHSPFGENIYCSSRWNLNCDLNMLSGLSLITSLAILATLHKLSPSPDIKVKWPNDILWGDKKLCGSLIEILAESNGNAQVIIGIGLNVNTDTRNHPLPDKPWCSLFEVSNQQFNRNIIIAHLLIHLETYITQFMIHGLSAFMNEWRTFDYLKGKQIAVTQSLSTFLGTAFGINQTGQLILKDEQGVMHYLSSGDTSIRSNALPIQKDQALKLL